MAASNSRLKDVDVAEESANMLAQQILSQAGTSMLAQANQLPQSALSLIEVVTLRVLLRRRAIVLSTLLNWWAKELALAFVGE